MKQIVDKSMKPTQRVLPISVCYFFFLFVEHSETASVVVHDVLVYISVFNQINDMYCT